MLFSRSSKCICRNTRDFGMVDTYGCIYLKLKKASAKVLSFGGAQKYTCCRMLFSHSSKCISLGACARDKALFTPPHFPEWKLSFPTNILVAVTYLGFLLYPKSLKGLLDLSKYANACLIHQKKASTCLSLKKNQWRISVHEQCIGISCST